MTRTDRPTIAPASAADGLTARVSALAASLRSEQAARIEAEAAAEAMSERMATVSHEIRTPLGAIIAMAELLLATQMNANQRHYADTLAQSARGLQMLLNDVLDYSKLEAGRFALDTVTFDIRKFARSVATALGAQAVEKGLESGLDVCDAVPARLVGDPMRMRQVLNNLIDNAVKFTETGSVRVRIDLERRGADRLLRFEVTDTGIGVSEAERAQLFQPFAQSDSSVAATYGGTGLGLCISRGLAEAMGGALDCESVPGEGSTFWFTVRVGEDASGVGPHGEDRQRRRTEAPLSGCVLIVEDNGINQTLIAAYLDRFGVSYDIAANGRQAIEAVSARAYDVVLMDVMMPEVDGVEATRRIRAMAEPQALVPIVALTANAMKGDRETYLAAGMDGYLPKPMNAGDLYRTLTKYLPALPDAEAG